jgi:hypothetical protein
MIIYHALKDLNPRHQVLETYVLPTELRARLVYNYTRYYKEAF